MVHDNKEDHIHTCNDSAGNNSVILLQSNDSVIKVNVQQWFKSHVDDYFKAGILKFVPRYEKCHNLYDEYVET